MYKSSVLLLISLVSACGGGDEVERLRLALELPGSDGHWQRKTVEVLATSSDGRAAHDGVYGVIYVTEHSADHVVIETPVIRFLTGQDPITLKMEEPDLVAATPGSVFTIAARPLGQDGWVPYYTFVKEDGYSRRLDVFRSVAIDPARNKVSLWGLKDTVWTDRALDTEFRMIALPGQNWQSFERASTAFWLDVR